MKNIYKEKQKKKKEEKKKQKRNTQQMSMLTLFKIVISVFCKHLDDISERKYIKRVEKEPTEGRRD